MNYFKKEALKTVKIYQEEIEFLHIFRSKQKRLHKELFTESWLSVAIDFRISRLSFKKSIYKRLFKI